MDKGTYVLATKYRDGDPCDQFCVGFFARMLGDRYLVEDGDGVLFRASGFRRCEKIQKRTGDILTKSFPVIGDRQGPSLWHWRRNLKKLAQYAKEGDSHE